MNTKLFSQSTQHETKLEKKKRKNTTLKYTQEMSSDVALLYSMPKYWTSSIGFVRSNRWTESNLNLNSPRHNWFCLSYVLLYASVNSDFFLLFYLFIIRRQIDSDNYSHRQRLVRCLKKTKLINNSNLPATSNWHVKLGWLCFCFGYDFRRKWMDEFFLIL